MSWPPWEATGGGGGGGGGGWIKGKPEAGWGWGDATVCGPVTGATGLSGGGRNLGPLILTLPLIGGIGNTWGWTTGFGGCSCGSNWAEESAKTNMLKLLWYQCLPVGIKESWLSVSSNPLSQLEGSCKK